MVSVAPLTADQLWQQALAEAGAEKELTDYLAAKSITRVATMALLTKTADEACNKIAEALITGTMVGIVKHSWTGDHDVLRATVSHLWEECTNQWKANQAYAQQQIAITAATASAATPPGTATASPGIQNRKVPKELPDGIWTQQIMKYNAAQINGVNRKFPEAELVGAETVLARLARTHHDKKLHPSQTGRDSFG